MPRHRHKGARSLVWTALVLILPLTGVAQERDVVFNQVTVSSQEAGIALEFADGSSLSAVLRDGRILVDGDEIGRFSTGGALERSWRALLGQAVAADNGEIAELLQAWAPPGELSGDDSQAAEALAGRITSSFLEAASPEAPTFPALSPEEEREVIQRLVLRPERLADLTRALQGRAPGTVSVHVGETVRVEAGEEVEGSLLLLDAELFLEGRVRGDVIVLGGEVALGDDARVDGDLRWTDARILGDRGAVRGLVQEVTTVTPRTEAELRAELERTLRDSLRDALRADLEPRATRRAGRDASRSVIRNFTRGLGGLFQTALSFVLLVGIGLATLYFFPRHFETVARTAHNATGRSALVGLAGLVLAFPAWVLGIVVLAVTVIGIPVMLLWLPAFPLAFGLAMILGYLAVGWNVGEWVSRRQFQGLEGFDTSRPAAQIGTGMAVLLGAFALAHLFRMAGPVLGVFHGLLTAVGVVLSMVAVVVGLGAVILSKAGRDRAYAGTGWYPGAGGDPFGTDPDPFSPEPAPFGARRERSPDEGDGTASGQGWEPGDAGAGGESGRKETDAD